MNTDRGRGRDRDGDRDADTSAATTTAATEEPHHTPADTSPPLTLRSAHPTDAPVIAAIHQASRRATMPYLPPQRRTHDEVTRWIREIVLPQCHTVVAARGPELLGYAAVRGDLLEHLYLRPDARRTGIGTRLLAEAQRHRPDGLTLHVFQLNAEARAFYAHHGFRVVATDDGSGNMENLPALTLRWAPVPRPLSPRGTP
ncbi:GNAT family N-acetyltransferase [Streptomyces tubercidicus]|uniref:GNAT family N-acetyltransferase n=1 Tax=Streptomyces tubercidicus TaxID=47759 RepID=UPI0032516EE9|nr:GNAT family N-acetyltransferase [Streptomyces tubercidicus]